MFQLLNRENVALSLKLCVKSNPKSTFVVTTTHLLYNPRRDDVRLAQVQLILAELEKFAKDPSPPNSYCPIIWCGDFNFTHHNAIFKLITKGSIQWTAETLDQTYAINNDCRFRDADETPQDKMGSSCTEVNPRAKFRKTNNENPRTAGVNLKHTLNFSSMMAPNQLEQRATTFHDYWVTVDHIFYTKQWDPVKRRPIERNLVLLSRFLPPLICECMENGAIPNGVLGSDHYLVGANFLIKN